MEKFNDLRDLPEVYSEFSRSMQRREQFPGHAAFYKVLDDSGGFTGWFVIELYFQNDRITGWNGWEFTKEQFSSAEKLYLGLIEIRKLRK